MSNSHLLELVLLLIAPVGTLVFALGEQFKWWDKLTGRSRALEGKERLYSAEGYPKTWIYRDTDEDKDIFRALERRINRRTSDKTMKKLIEQGIRPHLITVAGEPFQLSGLEPKMKKTIYAEIHPVVYIYKLNEQNRVKEKVAHVTNLGELSRWLEDEKANRRFWVTSFTIGILSLTVLLLKPIIVVH